MVRIYVWEKDLSGFWKIVNFINFCILSPKGRGRGEIRDFSTI